MAKEKENYTKEELAQILEKFISFIWSEVGIHYPVSLGIDAKDKFINNELQKILISIITKNVLIDVCFIVVRNISTVLTNIVDIVFFTLTSFANFK